MTDMDRADKAVELFKSGCNCSQAVLCAYSDLFGIDNDTAMKVSEAFGGGMGRLRMTCGAVSGMFMLVGLKYSKGVPKDLQTRKLVYGKVQELAGKFKEKHGSVICAELLGVNKPADNGAAPTERTAEFYKKRPCISCIYDCAKLVEEYLVNEEECSD